MTPAQARSIIRDALALCALVALVAFVAMVLTWSALAAKADDDDGKVTGGVVFYLTSMPRGLVSVVI